jgi:hypothetical protein
MEACMISRRTTLLVAGLLESAFRRYNSRTYGTAYYTIDSDAVYDFLFENDYPAWFCNLAKAARGSSSTNRLLKNSTSGWTSGNS